MDGAPAPAGTDIMATIDGTVCGQTVVDADSTYRIDVLSAGDVSGCATNGATVVFWVGNCPAGTGTWYSTNFTDLDLDAVCG